MNRILVAGGDRRQLYAAQRLSQTAEVYCTGFPPRELECWHLQSLEQLPAAESVQILLLPIPAGNAEGCVPVLPGAAPLSLSELLGRVCSDGLVLGGGKCPPILAEKSAEMEYRSYLQEESFQVANAVLTAEGALQLAMEQTVRTLAGSRVLILGYGRIGTVLASALHALGAAVTVAARQSSDRAWARAAHCQAEPIPKALEQLSQYDLIFNTVPALLLDRMALERVRADALLLDLASRPGGVDWDAAQELGLRAVPALSLPGKVAPQSAGFLLADTAIQMIQERGTMT